MKLFWIILFFLCCYPLPSGSTETFYHRQVTRKNFSTAKVPDIGIPDDIKNTRYTGFLEDMFSDTKFCSVSEAFREYPYCYQYKQSFKEGIFYYYSHCFNKTTDPLLELDIPPPLLV